MNYRLNLIKTRIDCFLIWGHGIKHLFEILNDIENNDNFKILKIIKHIPKSQKNLVKEVYSYDYAPFEHLNDKTKYLNRVDNLVCFIIIENLKPNEDFFGNGPFRHIESVTLKIFKEKLRDKYNPYENGIRSHNHILHACDNETQTHFLLKYLGYKNGLKTFMKTENLFNFPYHINYDSMLQIKKIKYEDLVCKIPEGEDWNSYSLKEMEIKHTPHYKSILNSNIYKEYIYKFIGGPIKDYNSIKKFNLMKNNFKYLDDNYYNSYVIVKKYNKKYLILDGIHRASLHFYSGNRTIVACLIND